MKDRANSHDILDSMDIGTASAHARAALNRFHSNLERQHAANMVFLAGKLDILPTDFHEDGSFSVLFENVGGSLNIARLSRPR